MAIVYLRCDLTLLVSSNTSVILSSIHSTALNKAELKEIEKFRFNLVFILSFLFTRERQSLPVSAFAIECAWMLQVSKHFIGIRTVNFPTSNASGWNETCQLHCKNINDTLNVYVVVCHHIPWDWLALPILITSQIKHKVTALYGSVLCVDLWLAVAHLDDLIYRQLYGYNCILFYPKNIVERMKIK